MITEKKIIQILNEWEFGANLKNGDFVRGVSREHYESIAKEIFKNNDLLHSVSECDHEPIGNDDDLIEVCKHCGETYYDIP